MIFFKTSLEIQYLQNQVGQIMEYEDKIYLSIGYLMTYSEEEGIFLSGYPYYLALSPGPFPAFQCCTLKTCNIEKLGMGLRTASMDLELQQVQLDNKCSNCTDVWYGVPLYLLLELVPVTLFYFIILAFPISTTYAPMTCFIMFSQLLMFEMIIDQQPPIDKLVITQLENNNNLLFKIFVVFYGIWSLELFNYLVPPFCISENVRLIHVAFLGYTSVAYQVLLIVVTWICIELHSRNLKLMVWLWRPFSNCFGKLQRKWDSE